MIDYHLDLDKEQECREVFDLYDNEKEGLIKIEDLPNALRSLGMNPTNIDIDDMMSEITDKKIQFSEFKIFYSKMLKDPDTEDDLIECFRIFDVDGSGVVSSGELRHILKIFGDKMEDLEIEHMISEGDPNDTGFINYVDLVKRMMQF